MKAFKFTTTFWRVCTLTMAVGYVGNASAQTMTEAWVQRFGEIGQSGDAVEKAVKDNSGNLIVAGMSDSGISSSDWLVVKYSGTGVPVWTNRYKGLANNYDIVTTVAVDGSDNVFVAGYTVSTNSNADYLTIAYSAAGIPLWTNLYNGTGNGHDYVRTIGVDTGGNVIVTGYSTGSGGVFDYATIAYSGGGVPLWTNRYDGPGNGSDTPTAMAMDGSGNIFVTGYSYNGSYADFTTIAYSGAGVPLWTNLYNGPGNSNDFATFINVGDNGDVLVTGSSVGSGSDSDFTTIAYSGAGLPLWTNRYDGTGDYIDSPTAVALDASGNLLITGTSYRSKGGYTESSYADFATVAYSGAGVPLWTNRYNGPNNFADTPAAIATDDTGNVFVTGRSSTGTYSDYATIAYSTSGAPLWTNRFDGSLYSSDEAIAVLTDGSGNIIVTGNAFNGTNLDYATIAYSGSGLPLWTNRYNGSGAEAVKGMIAAGDGNLFIVGNSQGAGPADIAIVAYSAAGLPLWTNRYDGPANTKDEAKAVAVDAAGNIIVSGRSAISNATAYISSTIAYSAAGVPLWTNRYNASPYSLAVAADGNVFVAASAIIAYSEAGVPLWTNITGAGVVEAAKGGNVFTAGGYGSKWPACMIFAYTSTGLPLWTNRYHPATISSDSAQDVKADGNGNVFLEVNANGICATIAYSSAGVPLWTNLYSLGQPVALALSDNGNVFVTAKNLYGGGSTDYHTIAYSGDGVPLWTNRYDGPASSSDIVQAVATDRNGNVFVTGFSSNGSSDDYVTIAYSEAGVPLWTNRYNGPANSTDQATAVAVDNNGTVFVTGYSTGTDGSLDYATIAYSGAGVPLSTNRYSGSANGSDQPLTKQSLAIAPDGTVVVTGSSDVDYSSATVTDIVTIKYLPQFPPSITIPPASQTSPPSGNINFFVTASGSGTLVYQWLFNNAPMPNRTNSSLSLSGVSLVDQGDYAVVVTNSYGSVTSSVAALAIALPGNNELSGQLLGAGAVQLSYMGQANASYVLERTFNLAPADWIPQATNFTDAGGVLFFTNNPAVGTNNFWRVRSGP